MLAVSSSISIRQDQIETVLVLQRQLGREAGGVATAGGAALGMGASGPFVTVLRFLQPPQQLSRPEPFPGQHLSHHPVDLRPRDPGHHFPPILLQAQQKSAAQQAQGHVVMPARSVLVAGCGSRTRSAPRRSAQSRTRFLCTTLSLPRRPGSPVGYPPERWTGSSAARCRPDSGDRLPSGSRRASAGWWDAPLGAEPVAAWTLATLGHRYLPPGLLRQFSAALRHCPPLPAHQPGFAGRPRPWYAGLVRSSSSGHTVKPAGTSRT